MSAAIVMQTVPAKIAGPGNGPPSVASREEAAKDSSFAAMLLQSLAGLPGQNLSLMTQADPANPADPEETVSLPVPTEDAALAAGMVAQVWALLARPAALDQEAPGTVQGQSGAVTLPANALTGNQGPSIQEKQPMQRAATALEADGCADWMSGQSMVETLSDPAVLAVTPGSFADPVRELEPAAAAGDLQAAGDFQQESVIASGADASDSESPDAQADKPSQPGVSEKLADERFEPLPAWTSDQRLHEISTPDLSLAESPASKSLTEPGLDWEHLVAAIALEQQPDGQRLTVRLRPDTMGQLEILFEQTDRGLNARIVVDNAETSQLLGSQVQALQTALADKGIDCTSIAVVYEQSAFTRDNPFQQHQGQASPHDPGSRHRQEQQSQSIPVQQDPGGGQSRPPVRHPVSNYIDRWT